jgi:hypothetical protein
MTASGSITGTSARTPLLDGQARLAEIEEAIVNTQAVTIDGLRVKARAACWARLGDLDPASGSTTDQRMALSIIRVRSFRIEAVARSVCADR